MPTFEYRQSEIILRAFLHEGSLDECNKRMEGLEEMAGSNPNESPRTSSEKSKRGKKEGSIGKKCRFFH